MGLRENLQEDRVRELALRPALEVGRTDTVRFAVETLREAGLGCLLVTEEHRPVGMLTEAMVRRLMVESPSSIDDPVSEHMERRFPKVRLDDPVAQVLEGMELESLRFVCVVDEHGAVAGLAGQKTLMEYVAEHFPGQVMVQRIGQPVSMPREGA